MIGKLKGLVCAYDDDAIIIDVGGVGYLVFVSSRTRAGLPEGSAAELIIETHVREDHIHLYGFPTTLERDWFRLLCTVQGVGNKTALAILAAYSPTQLVQSVLAKDITAFKAISGIGPKLAERIVTELKDKVTKLPTSEFKIVETAATKGKSAAKSVAISAHDDAISALVNLGYSRSEAYGAVMKAESGTLDELIKQGLKELVKR